MEMPVGFIVAGFALAGSPGPANLSLAGAGAAFGSRRCLGYLAGMTSGLVLVMGIIATGFVALLLALPGATPVVVGLSAAYFAYLAYRIATAPPLADDANARRNPSFAGGMFLNLVNPKGYAAVAALFSGFSLAPDWLLLDIAAKGMLLTAISAASSVALLVAGTSLTRYFREPRTNRIINITFAILLIASVALAFAL